MLRVLCIAVIVLGSCDVAGGNPSGTLSNKTVNIVLKSNNSMFVDNKPVNEAQLAEMIREEQAKKEDIRAVVWFDRTAHSGDVTRMIDILRSNDVTNFTFEIDKSQGNIRR